MLEKISGSPAILAVKRSASGAPDVNQRSPLCTGYKHSSNGSILALKIMEAIAWSSKEEYQWTHKKDIKEGEN